MDRWTRQDKHTAGVALIFAGIAGLAVAWEAANAGFNISASGLTPVAAGLLGLFGILGGALLIVLS